jgi:hypothetical protein
MDENVQNKKTLSRGQYVVDLAQKTVQTEANDEGRLLTTFCYSNIFYFNVRFDNK